MSKKLDQDLIEHACDKLGEAARRHVREGMGPASAARAAIRETQVLFPHDWRLAVQGDDREEEVEVWEIEHKRTYPCARILREPAPMIEYKSARSRGPRSSIRMIRGRQAALRDYNQLVLEKAEGPKGDANVQKFLEGFEFIRSDLLAGRTPEEAFDLSTSVKGAGRAFHDGAAAARSLYNSRRNMLGESGFEVPKSSEIARAESAQATKLARAYGIRLPD
jgi:hypothetical protein